MRSWGTMHGDEFARLLIVSPHLDDAVLSCGELLYSYPGALVVTVFAGNPAQYPVPQREWDRQCGFHLGDDVMQARRDEDRAALAILNATPHHLSFVEYTYNEADRPVRPSVIAPTLASVITEFAPTAVLAPFGLANPDHDVVHRAAMLVHASLGGSTQSAKWFAYEDFGYKHIPGMLAWRVTQLFGAMLWPTPICPKLDLPGSRKREAVECYPSQLLALQEDWNIMPKLDAPAPEQYWRLDAPPHGWELLAANATDATR